MPLEDSGPFIVAGLSCLVGMGFTLAAVTASRRSYSTFVHLNADISPLIRVKTDKGSTEKLSLAKLVETRCPTLFSDFNPVWWVRTLQFVSFFLLVSDYGILALASQVCYIACIGVSCN